MTSAPQLPELDTPNRILLAPGPTNVHPRVYRAMMNPVLGHLDRDFLKVMDDVQVLLKRLFRTENRLTFPVSATGSGGMDTAMLNLLEEGDTAIVTAAGYFGARFAEMARRTGANVIELTSEPGKPIDPAAALAAAKEKNVKNIKLLGVTHGETSTGVVHDLGAFRKVADELGALLVVDAVATVGGIPLDADKEKLDLVFTGSQKCLSAPPGLAPLTGNDRAIEVIKSRKRPVPSWYFDLTFILNYWGGGERSYHHTAPVSMNYALREALRMIDEEGLEARWERHRDNQTALVTGLEAMGLDMLAAPEHRLTTVVAVRIPEGVSDAAIRTRLMDEFNIEIAGGVGELKGKIWRIGMMGTSCTKNNVLLVLSALEKCLVEEGYKVSPGAGAGAATQHYTSTPATPVGAK